jgi:hypothetical protein
METEYFFCEECEGGCGLVVEFPKALLEICDGGVRIPETCPYMETQGNKAKWKKKSR